MHTLTEKIMGFTHPKRVVEMDSIIRTYLGEKAKELDATGHRFRSTNEILGLSSEVGEPILGAKEYGPFEHPKPKDSEVWCGCSVMIGKTAEALQADASCKYCPYCGKPTRPTPKTLESVIEKAVRDCWWDGKSFDVVHVENLVENIVKAVQHFSKEAR